MKRKISAGSTSNMEPIFIQDTTSTTGAGLGSLVYNTSGLAAKYRREGASSWTTISLVTATVGTFTSGGFVADGGPVTGGYELGIPDAAVAAAAGVRWVEIEVYGAANMLPVLIQIELDAVNYQDSAAFGLTAVPATLDATQRNAAADALLDRANAIETSFTVRQAIRILAAAMAGKLSGAAGTTVTIRNVGDTKDRVVATVDANGDRTAITLDSS